MGKRSGPRRGSLGFSPRKRAKRIFPSVRTAKGDKGVLTFAGYKAGMTTVFATDNYQNSPSYGLQIAIPSTIIECPSLHVFGARIYAGTPLLCAAQVFSEKLDKDLARGIDLPKQYYHPQIFTDFLKHI